MSGRTKHVVLSRAALSEMDPAEMEAAGRLGARRFRRWANDRILRDLAGKLTAEDMQSLFSPVPFGNEPVKSVMQQAAEPEVYAIWESFLSIDMDKQSRVLKKWEEHISAQRRRGVEESKVPAEVKALRAWASISRKARHALRRAPTRTVELLEEEILTGVQAEGHADLYLSSGFHRLLAHGIAEYHGLRSVSRPDPVTAARVTRVAWPRPVVKAATSNDGNEDAGAGAAVMQAATQALREIRVAEVLYLMSEFGGSEWHQPPPDAEADRPDHVAAHGADAEQTGIAGRVQAPSAQPGDEQMKAAIDPQRESEQAADQDPAAVKTINRHPANDPGCNSNPPRQPSGDEDSWVVL